MLPKGDKFAERSFPAILIGYSELQNGYILLDIKNNKIFVHKDVIFQEDTFPFAVVTSQSQSPDTVHDSPLQLDKYCDSNDDNDEDLHINETVVLDSGSAQSDSEVQEEIACESSLLQNGSDDTIQTPIVIADPHIRRTTRITKEPT